MTPDDRWDMPENSEDYRRIFASAKTNGPQVVFDTDGAYTVSFAPRGKRGSAQDFLTEGVSADESK